MPAQHTLSHDLQHAAEFGDVNAIHEILAINNPSAFSVYDNNVALVQAAKAGHADCVSALLPVCRPQDDDSEALRYAAKYGHLEIVRALLPASNASANGFEALWQAACQGHTDIVLELLPFSAPKSKAVHTALLNASMKGHVDVARVLLSKQPSSDNRYACLVEAASHGHAPIAQALHEHSSSDVLRTTIDMLNMDAKSSIEDPQALRQSHEKTFAVINAVGDHWTDGDLQELIACALKNNTFDLSECPVLKAHHEKCVLALAVKNIEVISSGTSRKM